MNRSLCCSPVTSTHQRRTGKVLVTLAITLPVLLVVVSYYVDGSMMLLASRDLQGTADAAATAAAFDLMTDEAFPQQTARAVVHDDNSVADAIVTTHIPPVSGEFAGRDGFVEVSLVQPYDGYFLQAANLLDPVRIRTRAVAGIEPATAPAAVVVLDPDPSSVSLGPLPIALPSVHPLLGGLEVIGLGQLDVDGAIHINNGWNGYDENGDLVGRYPGLRSASTCTPLLPLTRVRARDIRVVGGVDNPDNYGPFDPSDPQPLQANRRAVPDPLRHLPAPTTDTDSYNVRADEHGGVTLVGVPLLSPPQTLHPGVYEWIDVIGARVTFEPGVYVIRSGNPLTGIGLSLVDATVQAEGVMFYLTNDATYSISSGYPDAGDGDQIAPAAGVTTLLPSVIIAGVTSDSRFTPLNDAGSPFDGMLLYQRRWDRRPIIIVQHDLLSGLLGNLHVEGNIYAKWANLLLVGGGRYRSAIAVGSLRTVAAFAVRITPTSPFAPAYDVFLTE